MNEVLYVPITRNRVKIPPKYIYTASFFQIEQLIYRFVEPLNELGKGFFTSLLDGLQMTHMDFIHAVCLESLQELFPEVFPRINASGWNFAETFLGPSFECGCEESILRQIIVVDSRPRVKGVSAAPTSASPSTFRFRSFRARANRSCLDSFSGSESDE